MRNPYVHWQPEQALDRLAGDRNCLCTVIEMIVAQCPPLLDSLDAPESSSSSLLVTVHNLKNVFGIIEATAGVTLSQRLQQALLRGESVAKVDRELLAGRLRDTVQELLHYHRAHAEYECSLAREA